MSSASATAPRQELLQFAESWKKIFSDALAQLVGEPVIVDCQWKPPDNLPAQSAEDLNLRIGISGAWTGALQLRLTVADATRILSLITPGESPADLETQRAKLLEWLRSVATVSAASLQESWGEVVLEVESVSDATAAVAWLSCSSAKLGSLTLSLQFDSVLAEALAAWREKHPAAPITAEDGKPAEGQAPSSPDQTEASNAAVESVEPEKSPEPNAAQQSSENAAASEPLEEVIEPLPEGLPGEPGNLDLLLDVELGVTLRFGERRMLLREVLELNAGAVIELDRLVQEPVDLLLDGRVIARGEVVVVDGNYGLRVTEIAAPAAPLYSTPAADPPPQGIA
ncbi:MAG TPA: flagellar motor switch protein FliN [Candidatus Sulfotelmatobacter sp.]|nr:flagellar motor switch protein FliN [Candidatus Sulfotelmatobacter sp.]